ncbi:MAG: hypothetical protein KGD64_05635 [Candidatus Heimdallarchaeota archaeon]|nr:hypothetical protein [Candidatus Heimdallarchaeota archaeon]
MNPTLSLDILFYSTESREKLEKCITNLLGYLPQLIEEEYKDHLILRGNEVKIESLQYLFDYIRKAKILDTVRRCVFIDNEKQELVFNFHKQALYVNKIAIITRDTSSPLGNLRLKIKASDPLIILDWIAPETEEGHEITKRSFEEIYQL